MVNAGGDRPKCEGEDTMRLPILFAAAATAAVAGAMLLTSVPSADAAYGGDQCLRFRDMKSLTRVDDKTAIAHARSSRKYIVTFRHSCHDLGRPGNYYKV